MTPYYDQDGVVIYHGDCRDVLPRLGDIDCLITDAPYGVGVDYDVFRDDPGEVKTLIDDVSPFVLSAKRAAVFSGVPQMWYWPKPKWVMCWSYAPATNEFSPWGYAQWQPVLTYGSDPYLATGRGPRPTLFQCSVPPDRRGIAHPCPKPSAVMRWVVGRASLPEDVIVDCFMGSGTTLRAAKDEGRRAIGIDLSERYCEIAAKRLAQGALPLEQTA